MTILALLAAALLAFLIGAAHSWLGEWKLIGPLLSPEHRQGLLARSEFARHVLRFAWHLTTIAWWGFAAILAALALTPADAHATLVSLAIAVTFFVTGLLTLIAGRGRHWAWVVFLAIAGLSAYTVL